MAGADTKALILDAAERLFAERGFSEVSLRQIITASGVNLAAVHYHFGSKEALIQKIMRRRIGPLNEERLARLDQAERRGGSAGPSLREILEALLGPALRFSQDPRCQGDIFMRLMGRAMSDPNEELQKMIVAQFKVILERFLPAFHKALPELSMSQLYWRLHFIIGAMVHTMTHSQYLQLMSGGLCDSSQTEQILGEVVRFAEAGLRAPAEPKEGEAL